MHSDTDNAIHRPVVCGSQPSGRGPTRGKSACRHAVLIPGETACARRRDLFLKTFSDLERLKVVDRGGTPQFWSGSPIPPKELTIVRLAASSTPARNWVEVVTGEDAGISALDPALVPIPPIASSFRSALQL